MIKLFKYRHIIFETILKSINYKIVFTFCSDEIIVRSLNKTQRTIQSPTNFSRNKVYNVCQKTIAIIAPASSCLLKGFIIKNVLNHFGYRENLAIGIRKNGNSFNAHAWIDKYEIVPNYIKIQ